MRIFIFCDVKYFSTHLWSSWELTKIHKLWIFIFSLHNFQYQTRMDGWMEVKKKIHIGNFNSILNNCCCYLFFKLRHMNNFHIIRYLIVMAKQAFLFFCYADFSAFIVWLTRNIHIFVKEKSLLHPWIMYKFNESVCALYFTKFWISTYYSLIFIN
jgi:hypothetical protein